MTQNTTDQKHTVDARCPLEPECGCGESELSCQRKARTASQSQDPRVEEIRKRLKAEAKSHSDFTKSAQARRTAEYIARGDLDAKYVGLEPGQTIYWQAAELISTLSAKLSAMQAERDRAEREVDDQRHRANAFERMNAELRAERDRMKEALAPFAAVADQYDDREDSGFEILADFDVLAPRLILGHFRDARAALEGGKMLKPSVEFLTAENKRLKEALNEVRECMKGHFDDDCEEFDHMLGTITAALNSMEKSG